MNRTLRQLRLVLDKSQEDIAKAAGLNPSYYSRIERGEAKPKFDTIINLSKALNSTPEEIFKAVLNKQAGDLDGVEN